MNRSPGIPVFGERLPGQIYVERPGAYALIRDSEQRIATLHVGRAFFLPGGGSAPDESPQLTLHREIMEECGRTIHLGPELGRAVEYIFARKENVYYQIHSTFFEARFMEGQGEHVEDDHALVWLSRSEAMQHLQRESQSWAVQQLIEKIP